MGHDRGGGRARLAAAIALGVSAALVSGASIGQPERKRHEPGGAAVHAVADAGPALDAAAADAGGQELEQAKSLFRSGIAMAHAGDYERALDYFLRSRDAYPSAKNTQNAAYCLDQLGRFDEALEMYETTLASYGDQLEADDRTAIANATAALRTKVASVEVSANADGTVLIDGRERGKTPLRTPIRVLPGKHVVRVMKDGYATFEATIETKAGDHAAVDAKLEPLAAAGQLRIEDTKADGARVFVDGVKVGKAPWEGTLGPGAHVVWSQASDTGSAPTAVTVLQGQTALVRLKSGPLGPVVRVEADPPTAAITLGGVAVGTGVFELRLPAGDYEASAREPGYFPQTVKVTTVAGAAEPRKVPLKLAIDPNDPRWPKPVVEIEPPLGHVTVGAYGALLFASSFGSAAESSCPDHCGSDSSVFGPLGGVRAGFRFRGGIAVELTGAYLSAGQTIDRTRTAVFPIGAPTSTVTYALHDPLRLHGPLVGVAASQRIDLTGWLALEPRATVGVLFGQVRDAVTGTAATTGASVPVQIANAGASESATRAVLEPEIGLVVPWNVFEFGAAMSLMFLPGSGVSSANGAMQVAPSCTAANPGAVGCAPSTGILASERLMGPLVFWVPQVNATYVFR